MKVLQVLDSIRIGGSEMIATNLAEGFMKSGIGCILCGLGDNGNLAQILNDKKVPYTYFSTSFGLSPLLMAKVGVLFFKEMPDVAITHHFRQLIHTVPAAWITRTRLIHVEHEYHFYEKQPHLLSKLEFFLHFVETFVVVSDEIRDWFRNRIPKVASKCISISNGVDTVRFQRNDSTRSCLRRSYSIGALDIVIGTCARLVPIKNLSFLLDCFAGYLAIAPASWLVIVGDGIDRQALETQANDLRIAQRVIFAGTRSNIEEYLSIFDIYANTSHNEGLPLSVLEAMSNELPVVAANVGSLSKVVCSKTGVLVARYQKQDFIDAFKMFGDNQELTKTIVENARKLVQEQYSQQNMISNYVRLINPE